jgi:assimilatory nitrate reductase catalytic subunit
LERQLPERLNGRSTLFSYPLDDAGPRAIWNEHRESTRGRDLDITGLSYDRLEAGPEQWPFPAGEMRGKARLYENGIFPTADGKARFANVTYAPLAEPRDARYPFSLTTGRLRDHWHGMSRTGTLGRLFGHVSEPSVQLHPQDMDRRGLVAGDLVHLTSRRGSLVLPVEASEQVGLSQAFVAMHWGEEFVSGRSSIGERIAGINALTTPAYCPTSRQPELKHTAVKILRAELPWSLLGMAWLPEDKALAARSELRTHMSRFAYATCVPFGREPSERGVTGVLFRAADYEAPAADIIQGIEALLGLGGPGVLRYADARKGQRRAMRLVHRPGDASQATLDAFVLSGDTSAEAWIKALLQEELPAQAYGRLLLSPGAKAPLAVHSRGRQVCTCFNVAEPEIMSALAACEGSADERLASVQERLRCGTNCGSCLPELKKLARTRLQPA